VVVKVSEERISSIFRIILMMEEICSSETFLSTYKITLCHNREEYNRYFFCRENLDSHVPISLILQMLIGLIRRKMAETTLSVEATREKETRKTKKSWTEEMMTAMQSRGLNIEDAQNRRLWRTGTGRRH
jgi:hypothetical protein